MSFDFSPDEPPGSQPGSSSFFSTDPFLDSGLLQNSSHSPPLHLPSFDEEFPVSSDFSLDCRPLDFFAPPENFPQPPADPLEAGNFHLSGPNSPTRSNSNIFNSGLKEQEFSYNSMISQAQQQQQNPPHQPEEVRKQPNQHNPSIPPPQQQRFHPSQSPQRPPVAPSYSSFPPGFPSDSPASFLSQFLNNPPARPFSVNSDFPSSDPQSSKANKNFHHPQNFPAPAPQGTGNFQGSGAFGQGNLNQHLLAVARSLTAPGAGQFSAESLPPELLRQLAQVQSSSSSLSSSQAAPMPGAPPPHSLQRSNVGHNNSHVHPSLSLHHSHPHSHSQSSHSQSAKVGKSPEKTAAPMFSLADLQGPGPSTNSNSVPRSSSPQFYPSPSGVTVARVLHSQPPQPPAPQGGNFQQQQNTANPNKGKRQSQNTTQQHMTNQRAPQQPHRAPPPAQPFLGYPASSNLPSAAAVKALQQLLSNPDPNLLAKLLASGSQPLPDAAALALLNQLIQNAGNVGSFLPPPAQPPPSSAQLPHSFPQTAQPGNRAAPKKNNGKSAELFNFPQQNNGNFPEALGQQGQPGHQNLSGPLNNQASQLQNLPQPVKVEKTAMKRDRSDSSSVPSGSNLLAMPMCFLNLDGKLLEANPQFYQLFGFNQGIPNSFKKESQVPSGVVSQPNLILYDLVPLPERVKLNSMIGAIVKRTAHQSDQLLQFLTNSGDMMEVLVSMSGIPGGEKISAILAVFTPTTPITQTPPQTQQARMTNANQNQQSSQPLPAQPAPPPARQPALPSHPVHSSLPPQGSPISPFSHLAHQRRSLESQILQVRQQEAAQHAAISNAGTAQTEEEKLNKQAAELSILKLHSHLAALQQQYAACSQLMAQVKDKDDQTRKAQQMIVQAKALQVMQAAKNVGQQHQITQQIQQQQQAKKRKTNNADNFPFGPVPGAFPGAPPNSTGPPLASIQQLASLLSSHSGGSSLLQSLEKHNNIAQMQKIVQQRNSQTPQPFPVPANSFSSFVDDPSNQVRQLQFLLQSGNAWGGEEFHRVGQLPMANSRKPQAAKTTKTKEKNTGKDKGKEKKQKKTAENTVVGDSSMLELESPLVVAAAAVATGAAGLQPRTSADEQEIPQLSTSAPAPLPLVNLPEAPALFGGPSIFPSGDQEIL